MQWIYLLTCTNFTEDPRLLRQVFIGNGRSLLFEMFVSWMIYLVPLEVREYRVHSQHFQRDEMNDSSHY